MGEGDLSGVLGKFLENPEALKGVMGLLSGLGSISKEEKGETSSENIKKSLEKGEEKAYLKGENTYTSHENKEDASEKAKDRRALLLALRPYMSKEKQEKIDGILKILKLLEVAETLGQTGIHL